MSPLTLPQMNGSTTTRAADDWLQATVQDFFSKINWDDHPPEVRPSTLSLTDDSPPPFSLEMSVGRFFAAINWEGNAIAAPAPIEQPKVTHKTEFTLDEFSDLF